jgi:hypothetical protein
MTFVPSGFCSSNIIVGERRTGLIDLEDSYWSYPALALWRFLPEITERDQTRQLRRALRGAYALEWSDVIPVGSMRALLGEMPLLAGLFRIVLTARECARSMRDLDYLEMPAIYVASLDALLENVVRALPVIPEQFEQKNAVL